MLQRPQNLGGEMHRFLPGQCTAALLEVFLQRDAVDILHHDILEFIGNGNIVHLHDIRMIQNRNGLGLILEAAYQFLVVQELFFQYLHRDGVSRTLVHATVDVGHAADADQTLYQIPAIQSFPNQIIHC